MISFTNISNSSFLSTTVGYKLDEEELKQGYMTEALRAAIVIIFKELKLHRIEANIMPHNRPSMNLVKKLGFTAPTGRAAKRMSEITGKEAKTIHRLLEVEWDKHDRPYFSRNARNPISAGAVIVDELSMVDISLFASLLDALPLGCRLIMVGDSDQLRWFCPFPVRR